jgi:hypothetical protein
VFNRSSVSIVLVIFIMCCTLLSSTKAQTKEQHGSSAQWFVELEMCTMLDGLLWDLSIGDGSKRAKNGDEVVRDLRSWVAGHKSASPGALSYSDKNVLKHATKLDSMFTSWGLTGRELAMFVYSDSSLPVYFTLRDSSSLLVVSGIATETVYNTQRSTGRSRAVKALTNMILPSLETLIRADLHKATKYFALCAVYGSKDFSDEGEALNQMAESTVFVAKASQCARFVAGEISEDELVDGADIYLRDREMVTGLKKVKLTIE